MQLTFSICEKLATINIKSDISDCALPDWTFYSYTGFYSAIPAVCCAGTGAYWLFHAIVKKRRDELRKEQAKVAKQQKEYLQMFFLVLQVCYYLMVGQVKSVKTVLKQLQQSIQTITAPGWPSDEEMLAMSHHPADAFQVGDWW